MLNHQRNKDNGLIVKSGLHNQGESFLITSITTDNTSNREEKKYPESSKNVLIDDYGNVNLSTLEKVKVLEKLLSAKEKLNPIIQQGGNVKSINFTKNYMSYNDYKFFTSSSFCY